MGPESRDDFYFQTFEMAISIILISSIESPRSKEIPTTFILLFFADSSKLSQSISRAPLDGAKESDSKLSTETRSKREAVG